MIDKFKQQNLQSYQKEKSSKQCEFSIGKNQTKELNLDIKEDRTRHHNYPPFRHGVTSSLSSLHLLELFCFGGPT
jgi:hypothetical protein